MKYVSIDIETTGLDSEKDQILQIAAIIEDTDKKLSYEDIPKYSVIIEHYRLLGSPYALNMNKDIVEILSKIPKDLQDKKDYFREEKIIKGEDFALSFHTFLTSNGLKRDKPLLKIKVAGKNFQSFDKKFINKLPYVTNFMDFGYRSIDPSNFFIDFVSDDEIPSLNTCLERAGIDRKVKHDALSDAWDVISVLRKFY